MTIMVNLIEQSYYDPDSATVKTLRVADKPFRTGPAETPANTLYEPCIGDAGTMSRHAYAEGMTTGESTVGTGSAVLSNKDHALDPYRRMAFGGQAHVRRRGPIYGGAYPADFPVVMTGIALQPVAGMTSLPLAVRDQQAAFDVPLQSAKYGGAGGLDGTADMVGQSIPITVGRPFNVTPRCVDPAKLIYQMHDAALHEIDAVRDRGAELTRARADGVLHTNFVTRTDSVAAINAMAFGNDRYVAVGDSGAIYTTNKGLAWERVTEPTPFGTANITAIGFNTDTKQFFAVTAWTGGILRAAQSADGRVWVLVDQNGVVTPGSIGGLTVTNIHDIHALTYSAALKFWFAGGENGEISTSPDLLTWTKRTSAFGGTETVWDICVSTSPAIIVAVGGGGRITSTTDGVTWTSRRTGTEDLYSADVGGGRLVVVGGADLVTSTNGTAWTTNSGALFYRSVAFIGTSTDFVVLTAGNGQTYTTSNGTSVSLQTNDLDVTASITNHAIVSDPATGHVAFAWLDVSSVTHFASTDYTGSYANVADLQDDTKAPLPGSYAVYFGSEGSFFRLGGSPAGTITCDPVEGATAADRTAAQCFVRQGMQRLGYTAGAWSASDVTALDGKNSAEIYDYIDQETIARTAMTRWLDGIGAFWFGSRAGVIRLRRLDAPTGSGAVLSIVEKDISPTMTARENGDVGNGTPVYLSILQFRRNFTPQPTDLAGGISDANRAVFGREWSTSQATGGGVLTAFPGALQRTEQSCLVEQADADTESARRQALRGVLRDGYDCPLEWSDAVAAVEIGDEVTLTHSRFGLSAGANYIVLDITDNPKTNRITPSLWGRAA